MAQRGKTSPAKRLLIWDDQMSVPNDQNVGIVEYDEANKSIAGKTLIGEAFRWPDNAHLSNLERPLTNVNQSQREALQWIGTQVLKLMPLIIDGEVNDSPDAEFHLSVTRSNGSYTITLEVPEVVGEKGDKGDKGDTGEAGADGVDGADGATGATGATGAAGADGEDCDCEEAGEIDTPDNPEGGNDTSSSCNIAGGLTEFIREAERKIIADQTSGVNTVLAIGGLAASIAAAIFTGGAAWPLIVAASTALISAVITADSSGLTLADDAFWNAMSCKIYCAIKAKRDITETDKTAIVAAIRATTYTTGAYDAPLMYNIFADFMAGLPLAVIRANVVVGIRATYDCDGCSECEDNGGCQDDLWAPYPSEAGYYGQILDASDGILMTHTLTQNTNGVWYVLMQLPSNMTGCKIKSYTLGTGMDAYSNLIGSDISTAVAMTTGQCIWAFLVQANFAFDFTIEFEPC